MKIVCYTCITGNYDKLHEPQVVPKDIDFVCFTNNPNLKSNIWKIRPIPSELENLSQVKKQRVIKICPHKYLGEYDVSIWIDGNIIVTGDLTKFVAQYDLQKYSFYTRKHPERCCVYDEFVACRRYKKETREMTNKLCERYKNEKFPVKYGLAETSLILRLHNNEDCKKLCDEWAKELMLNSHRDQLSFNYVCWKLNATYGVLIHEPKLKNNANQIFNLISHGK